jgi:O-antigen ligase
MRSKIADSLPKISWGFFFATLVLIPFRFRFLLLSRPIGAVWRDYTDFILFASDITLVLTLLTWLFHLYLQPRKILRGPALLTLPLIGLTLAALATSVTSIDPALSFYHSVRLVMLFGFYLYIVNNVKSIGQIVPPILIQLAIQAPIAITQILKQKSIGLQFLGEYELDPAWRGVSVIWTETARSLRAYGLSDHPNILGGCLALAFLLVAVWLLYRENKWPVLAIGILGAGGIALLLTFSRSAWLGVIGGAVFVALYVLRRKTPDLRRRSVIIAAALLLIISPFIWVNLELLGVRLGANSSFEELPAERGSIGGRRVLISAANEVFAKNAILGVGIGTTPQAFEREFPTMPIDYQPAHMVLLTAAVETGLLGAMFYLVLLTAPWLAIFLTRSVNMTPDLIATSALLLALTIIGLFDYYPWMLTSGRLWQYLAWGLWALAYTNAKKTA